jgi:hypothetical protein
LFRASASASACSRAAASSRRRRWVSSMSNTPPNVERLPDGAPHPVRVKRARRGIPTVKPRKLAGRPRR